MRKETFMQFHIAYQDSLYNSFELVEAIDRFNENLRKIETADEEEQRQIDEYISQLVRSSQERKNSDAITDLIENIACFVRYFTKWYNTTVREDDYIFIGCGSRRKALESELKKIFQRTINGNITPIKDRFGCEIVVCPNRYQRDEQSVVYNLYKLCNMLLDCFSGNNSKLRNSFLNWLETQHKFDVQNVISRIEDTLSINFDLSPAEKPKNTGYSGTDIYIPSKSEVLKVYKPFIKDYCISPKDTGYQALHYILSVPPFASKHLAGIYIEFQMKTYEMFARANDEENPASHSNHKDTTKKIKGSSLSVDEVLYIEDWDLVTINGFRNRLGKIGDIVGLRYPVSTIQRNVLM